MVSEALVHFPKVGAVTVVGIVRGRKGSRGNEGSKGSGGIGGGRVRRDLLEYQQCYGVLSSITCNRSLG